MVAKAAGPLAGRSDEASRAVPPGPAPSPRGCRASLWLGSMPIRSSRRGRGAERATEVRATEVDSCICDDVKRAGAGRASGILPIIKTSTGSLRQRRPPPSGPPRTRSGGPFTERARHTPARPAAATGQRATARAVEPAGGGVGLDRPSCAPVAIASGHGCGSWPSTRTARFTFVRSARPRLGESWREPELP